MDITFKPNTYMKELIARTNHTNGRIKKAVFVEKNKTMVETYFSNGQISYEAIYQNGVCRKENYYTKGKGLVSALLRNKEGVAYAGINHRQK